MTHILCTDSRCGEICASLRMREMHHQTCSAVHVGHAVHIAPHSHRHMLRWQARSLRSIRRKVHVGKRAIRKRFGAESSKWQHTSRSAEAIDGMSDGHIGQLLPFCGISLDRPGHSSTLLRSSCLADLEHDGLHSCMPTPRSGWLDAIFVRCVRFDAV